MMTRNRQLGEFFLITHHKSLMCTHFRHWCAILFPIPHVKKGNVATSKYLGNLERHPSMQDTINQDRTLQILIRKNIIDVCGIYRKWVCRNCLLLLPVKKKILKRILDEARMGEMREACLPVACNQDVLLLPSGGCQTWLRKPLSCLLLEVSQYPGEALLKLDLILHFSSLCYFQHQLCRVEFCFDLTQSIFKIILINLGIGQENIAGHFNRVWSNDQLRICPISNML